MDPRDARPQLAGAIEDDLTLFAVGIAPPALYDVLDRIGQFYPALGIAQWLATGEPSRLRECLVRSAYARLRLLRDSAAEQPPPRQRAASFSEGFLDAVAAGHWRLVRDIATHSPADWLPAGEYEDDFCYYRLLFGFAADMPPDPAPLLARFARALEGRLTPRLALCRALAAAAAADFADAFADFVREEQDRGAQALERYMEGDASAARAWMRSFVSVEALCLLALAGRLGLEPPGPHPLVPPGARLRGGSPDYPDPFAELEAAR